MNLHAPGTPEIYVMDLGQGQLANGYAHIDIDPIVAGSIRVDATHPMHVFIQLDDDDESSGVVVKNKTASGFDVVERQHGHSNAVFQWQLLGNREDELLGTGVVSRQADVRLERAPRPPASR